VPGVAGVELDRIAPPAMISVEDLELADIEALQEIRGIPFPQEPKFRQFLITGPPGAGKSTMVKNIRGWPYEGYLDLSIKSWWRSQALAFRPREIHLGVPFFGYKEALTVIDDAWIKFPGTLDIDFQGIKIPPDKSWLLGTSWRQRYVYEFLLPPAPLVLRDRNERATAGLFPGDKNLTLELVTRQLDLYRTIAWYLWTQGLEIYIREDRNGAPKKIVRLIGLNADDPKDLEAIGHG
jgi:hypothetical protein